MTPERWREVKRVFEDAAERDPAEREAYLQSACQGDPDLRAEVESLLAAGRDAGSRYDDPIVSGSPAQDPIIGRHVAAYKIVRRLGAGGMGAVYLASRDDDQFRRLVAIKLIRPELLDENTRRRFHNERQTLAALEHPNIVKLVDGGTTEDGWPFLIMDYVEGQPIDRFVKERDLPVAERLEFVPHTVRGGALRSSKPGGASRPKTSQHHGDAAGRSQALGLRHRSSCARPSRKPPSALPAPMRSR